MKIRTQSKPATIRRAGVRHTREWQEWPDGTFTAAQLKQLRADPDLIVEVEEKLKDPKDPK